MLFVDPKDEQLKLEAELAEHDRVLKTLERKLKAHEDNIQVMKSDLVVREEELQVTKSVLKGTVHPKMCPLSLVPQVDAKWGNIS